MVTLSGNWSVGHEKYILEKPLYFTIGTYLALISLIIFQNVLFRKWLKKRKSFFVILANCEILGFFCLYFFLFSMDLLIERNTHSNLISLMLPVILYLGALFIFHFSFDWKGKIALKEIKLILPFLIPVFFLAFMADSLEFFSFSFLESSILGGVFILLTIFVLTLFMPPLICYLWECVPLANQDLKMRLETVCRKANFKHAGLREWALLKNTPTAAILGILPKYRYILFTPALLNHLPPEAIEAVLAHEIGHSQRKHLLFFPIILFGMLIFAAWFVDFLTPFIEKSSKFQPLILFLLFASAIAFYFRFVFGFFSRLFEREADLYGMELNIPLSKMILALHTLGVLTGNSHNIRNWHHFSIHERIAFLKKVAADPSLAKTYLRKVMLVKVLLILFFTLAIASYFL